MLAEGETDQWEALENSETDPHNICSADSDKGIKATQWSKHGLFKKWCGSHWTYRQQQQNQNQTKIPKLDLMPTLYIKINSK